MYAAADAVAKLADKPARPQKTDCKRPFFIDAQGIKRLTFDCLSSRCEPPWFTDAKGVLRMKPECSSSAGETGGKKGGGKKQSSPKGSKKPADEPLPGREPTWYLDPNGLLSA